MYCMQEKRRQICFSFDSLIRNTCSHVSIFIQKSESKNSSILAAYRFLLGWTFETLYPTVARTWNAVLKCKYTKPSTVTPECRKGFRLIILLIWRIMVTLPGSRFPAQPGRKCHTVPAVIIYYSVLVPACVFRFSGANFTFHAIINVSCLSVQ